MAHRPSKRMKKTLLGGGAIVLLAGLNAPAALSFATEQYHAYEIAQPEYMAKYGAWNGVDIPKEYRTNAIHAALLHTGKVLIIAGSGNKQDHFDAGTFDTVLWNPKDNSFKKIPTPADFFCGGHAQLPDGNLLVAGGTARYEVLDDEVKRAGGGMRVKNENPDKAVTVKKGTKFRSPSGIEYVSKFDVTVPPAKREFEVAYYDTGQMKPWKTKTTAGEARVFVEAVAEGPRSVATDRAQYEIEGLTGKDADDVYGLAEKTHPGQAGLPGHQGGVRIRPEGREVHPGRPDEGGPLVPDAHHAPGRPGARRLRARRRGRHPRGRQRDLRPEDQAVVQGPLPLLPDLPLAVPDQERQALLLGRQRRVRARRQGPRARPVGRREEHLHQDRRPERHRPAGDGQLAPAASRPGPAVHAARRRRGRRVQEVHAPHRRGGPQEEQPRVQVRAPNSRKAPGT